MVSEQRSMHELVLNEAGLELENDDVNDYDGGWRFLLVNRK